MGANAQTTVPTFTASQVLTADQMNQSARTGVPVFATTVTRDAAFGGTGEKTLAEGQMCYIEGTGFQTYNGSSWVTWGTSPSGGLDLVKTQTIGTGVSSVTVSDAFSSTYDNYKITINGGSASATGYLQLQLGATTTAYYGSHFSGVFDTNAFVAFGMNNAASFLYAGRAYSGQTIALHCDVFSPNLAKWTTMNALQVNNNSGGFGMAYCNQESTTQFTAFTITPSTGTLTGGTIRIYGYKN